jgi:phytanoyl-CoA hydroxylase
MKNKRPLPPLPPTHPHSPHPHTPTHTDTPPHTHTPTQQDGAFLYTEPQSVVGFWWALEDCSTTNGCLWAVPGSHRQGVQRRFKRRGGGQGGTEFDPPEQARPFDLTGAVPLEVGRGALVVLHNALVHYSAENRSTASRHAYSVHVVEGGEGTVYPEDNWLQRPVGDGFRVLP